MTPLTEAFATALLSGAVTAGVPLLLAGLGEQMSERAGVLNIGIEGYMLAGAYAGFVGVLGSNSFALGLACGAGGGALVAAVMVLACVLLRFDQIVVGIALTIGVEGLTALLHHAAFSRTFPRLPAPPVLSIPVLADWPVVGPAIFAKPVIFDLALAAVPMLAWLYRATYLGAALQAAGERPAALDAAGVGVGAIRGWAVLAAGALTGLGGAILSTIGAGLFVPYMTNGAGFLGIVLAMLARGRPLGVLGGAMLFGLCLSLQTALQVSGVAVPTDLVEMIPFAAVLVVLALVGRRASLPAALGTAFRREDR